MRWTLLLVVPAWVLLPQDSGRTPLPPPVADSGPDLRALPLTELVCSQPERPRFKTEGGDWATRPEVEELQRRVESGELSSDDWRYVLLEGEVFHTRAQWPQGEALNVWIHEQPWLRYTRITARALDPDIGAVTADNMHPSWCGNCREGQLDRQRHLAFQPLPAGTKHVDLDVVVEQRDDPDELADRERGSHVLWRGWLRLPVEAVSSLQQVLPSSSTEVENRALQGSIRARWWTRQAEGATPRLSLAVGGETPDADARLRLAVSLAVELRYQGTRRAEVLLTARPTKNTFTRVAGMQGWCSLEDLAPDLSEATANVTGWELVFRGVSEGVLPIWEADRWWNGSFSMTLADALKAHEQK